MQAPNVEPETIQTQYTDGKAFLLQDSSALVSSKVRHDAVDCQFSDGKLLLLQDSTPKEVKECVVAIMDDLKVLEIYMFYVTAHMEFSNRVFHKCLK